jgi:hypothetical protein
MKKTVNKTAIIAIIMILLLLFVLVACNEPNIDDITPEEDLTPTKDMLVNNGTFYLGQNTAGTNAYVKDQVPGWTARSGSISYSETEMGVIDLTETVFNANVRQVIMPDDNMTYPGIAPSTPKEQKDGAEKPEDTGALVISNLNKVDNIGSVYFATSSAITVKKNTYYKLIIDVYTDITDAPDAYKGAYIFVTGGLYFEIEAINTEKTWETFEFYIEGNNYEDRSINIELWLGHGPGYIGKQEAANKNPRLTSGVALFDNVILKEITQGEYSKMNEGEFVKKGSLVFADPGFTYNQKINSTTTVSSTTMYYYGAKLQNPQLYDFIIGKETLETGEDRPTVITGNSGTYGIFDMSKFWAKDDEGNWEDTFKKLNSEFRAPAVDTKKGLMDFTGRTDLTEDNEYREYRALMIYHSKASGAGYKSQKKLAIEANTYYTISVWVYVWKPEYTGTVVEDEPAVVANPEKVEKPTEVQDPGEDASQEEKDAFQDYLTKKAAYDQYVLDKAAYDKYLKDKEDYDKYQAYINAPTAAEFRLSGASVEGDLSQKSTELDQWQKLEFKVKGTQLSSRFVNLSFWYGEGVAGASTLCVGGALFDNISITVDKDLTEAEKTAYTPISAPEKEEDDMTGLVLPQDEDFKDIKDISQAPEWKFEFAKGLNENSELVKYGIIKGDAAVSQERWSALDLGLTMPGTKEITLGEPPVTSNYNVLLMQNLDYTAAKLRYVGNNGGQTAYKDVMPNSFYRISMWVKTEGMDKNRGLTVNLLDTGDVDDIKTLTSISNFNKGEWTELIFYVKGDTLNANSLSIEFVMGTGDTFTPTDHLKGAAFVTAIIMQNIGYKEFNDADTGDFAKKYTFSSTLDTSNTVTNGYFQNIDYEDTVKKDKDAINDKGELVGVATPSNWSLSEPITSLDKPKNLKQDKDNKKLTWDKVKNAETYEIYVTSVEIDGVMYYDKLIAEVGAGDEDFDPEHPSWDYSGENSLDYSEINGSYKIRACTNKKVTEGEKDLYYGISDFSSPLANTSANKDNTQFKTVLEQELSSSLSTTKGIINTKKYTELGGANIYPEPELDSDNKFSYFSTKSDNALMLESNYYTRMGYTMSSTASLAANSYYELSVWVKTVGTDTRASVTINNSSNIFYKTVYANEKKEDGNYVGFVNINTADKWVKYTFYAKTGVISATLKLELWLGNKYAIDVTNEAGDTVKGGLAKGQVYFDDVYFKSIDEDTYNEKIEAEENTELDIEEFFSNKYIYKKLIYTTDSFDVYTEESAGSKNGHTPKDYSHSYAPDAQTGDEDVSVHGIFKAGEIGADHAYIYEGFGTGADRASFIPENFGIEELRTFLTGYGDNVLFMANFSDRTGQKYTSTTKTFNSDSYYKITFFAKTMLPEGKYAEFRFEPGTDTESVKTIRINTAGKVANELGFVEYTMYIYNPRTSSVTSNKISFHLGSKVAGETEDNFLKGMLVIDNVSLEQIEKAEYDTATDAYEGIADNDAKLNAVINVYEFKKTEEQKPDEPGEEEKPPKQKGFTDQLWLLISTILIGAAIVGVLISVGYKKFKAKYKKKETVVNKVDTAKSVVKESQKRRESSKKDINLDEFKD